MKSQAAERRKEIIQLLMAVPEPVTGQELAEKFGVTRQIIVQDIALLRAEGREVISTPRGYIFLKDQKDNMLVRRTFACQHGPDRVEEELLTFVELGGRVLDVSIEHPLYGELKGMLMLQTVSDVENFMEQFKASNARLLSALTNGVHLHTVEAVNNSVLDRITTELDKQGLLLTE